MNNPQKINNRQKGCSRDKAILQAVEEYRALNTDQIYSIFFSSLPTGQRKAQERLTRLHRMAKIQRTRFGDTYTYYHGEKSGLLAHLLGLNWVRIWIEKKCRSWEQVQSFTYEQDYGILRTDSFVAVKNKVAQTFKFYFVEMDRGTNEFDKVRKYCQLFKKGDYSSWWWVKLTDRFPPVLIVTTAPRRAETINRLIEIENVEGLEFRLLLLDEIKREVMNR